MPWLIKGRMMKNTDPIDFHDRLITGRLFARSPLYLLAGLGMTAGGAFLLWEAIWHPHNNYVIFGDRRFLSIACPILLSGLGASMVVMAVNAIREAVRVPPPPHK